MFINKDTRIDLNAELSGGVLRILGYLSIGKVEVQYHTANVFETFIKSQNFNAMVNDLNEKMLHELDEHLTKNFEQCKTEILQTLQSEVYDIFGVKQSERNCTEV